MAKKALEDVLAMDSADVANMFENAKKKAEDAEGEILREIALDDIWQNPLNFYGIRDVEELAESVKLHGLMDPLVVYPMANGKFRLISGHRRWAALHTINAETALCRVVAKPESDAAETLMLIQANSTGRVLTPLEIAMQAEKMTAALIQRRKEGVEFSGRTRDIVADALGISPTALARKKVIKDRLAVPGFRQAWERGKLPEAAAYELAQLPQDDQYKALDLIIDAGKNYESVDIKTVQKVKRQIENGESTKQDLCVEAEKRGIPIKDEDFSPLFAHYVRKAVPERVQEDLRGMTKAQALDRLHRFGFGHAVQAGPGYYFIADPNGLTIKEPIGKRLKWAEVWELLALAAMREPPKPLTVEEAEEVVDSGKAYEWAEPAHEYDPPEVEAELAISEVVSESDTVVNSVYILADAVPGYVTQLAGWFTGTPEADGRYLCCVRWGKNTTELNLRYDTAAGRWMSYDKEHDAAGYPVLGWWPLPERWKEEENGED
ncbi:MAG: ParB N-terminal domain-containing protein [Clostridia bacterium]|nr:ParB N-terminal domain-containing protein [Clostridia bacterium]